MWGYIFIISKKNSADVEATQKVYRTYYPLLHLAVRVGLIQKCVFLQSEYAFSFVRIVWLGGVWSCEHLKPCFCNIRQDTEIHRKARRKLEEARHQGRQWRASLRRRGGWLWVSSVVPVASRCMTILLPCIRERPLPCPKKRHHREPIYHPTTDRRTAADVY